MKYFDDNSINHFTEKVVDLLKPQKSFFESDMNIFDYSKSLFSYKAKPIHIKRQKVFLEILLKKIKKIFTENELEKIQIPDYSDGMKAGIVNHHGILNNPVLIGVDIVSNYFRLFNKKTEGDILAFSTGNNPFNNFFHRRGFEIDGNHVNLYPKSMANKIVYMHPCFDFKICNRLMDTHQWKMHSKETKKFLENIDAKISSIDFSQCEKIGDQLTKINFYLWPLLFTEDLRSNVSNLLSIEYDDVVSDFLVYIFENEPESLITKLLFDGDNLKNLLNFFEGEVNAWNKERNTGTHIFWGLKDYEHTQLFLSDNKLKSISGEVFAEFTKDSIIDSLKKRKIFGGMFLKYTLLVLYCGIKPFAGYASANSIAHQKNKLIDFYKLYFPEEIDNIKDINVANLTSIPVLLHRNADNIIEGYYAFDIIKNGGLGADYFDRVNSVPVKNFMIPNLPAMYDYAFNLFGNGQKEDLKLNQESLEKILGNIVK